MDIIWCNDMGAYFYRIGSQGKVMTTLIKRKAFKGEILPEGVTGFSPIQVRSRAESEIKTIPAAPNAVTFREVKIALNEATAAIARLNAELENKNALLDFYRRKVNQNV
jgi:hypothetical protein